MAGDLVVVSMNLAGKVRIWQLPGDMDKEDLKGISNLTATREFTVENATGTLLKIVPPRVSGVGDVYIVVACLDGTCSYIATGISTPKATKDPTNAGTVISSWSKPGVIAMSLAWHPSTKNLAVGRQDGLVEIVGEKNHRLVGSHETPVRAISYTPDANLLVSGSDEGMIVVWDTSRSIPAMVNHVTKAHDSWILSLSMMDDSRRFVTGSADCKLNVWSVGQMNQALHTFSCDDTVWSLANLNDPPRLVAGSEQGGLQIYSLEP
jgi:WD40 repeat protein